MKETFLKYFHNYRKKYDKLTTFVVLLLIFFSIVTVFVPIFKFVVMLLICSLFTITFCNLIVLQYDLFIFFEEVSKQLDEMTLKMK